jgi:hypothetical protein
VLDVHQIRQDPPDTVLYIYSGINGLDGHTAVVPFYNFYTGTVVSDGSPYLQINKLMFLLQKLHKITQHCSEGQ